MDFFSHLTKAPDDPILHLVQLYRQDPRDFKVNLSVGVYFNEQGKQENFEAVNLAQKAVAQFFYNTPSDYQLSSIDSSLASKSVKDINISYLPTTGYKGFNEAIRELVFPSSLAARQTNRISSFETVAGSGGLRLVGEFLKRSIDLETIHISNPTWSNHHDIFKAAGLQTKEYTYYSPTIGGIDFQALLSDLDKLTPKDAVLFHAACHNPTGYDLSHEQWQAVLNKVKEKGAFPVFDYAYQGFGDGLDEDSYSVRLASEIFTEALVISSCSKNFGLYGDRLGAIHIIGASADHVALAISNMQAIANDIYVCPGNNAAFVATTILNNPDLYQLWVDELAAVRNRINGLRHKLARAMAERGVDFSFVVEQRGMFSYTGMTKDEVDYLRDKYGIYMVHSGRVNIAGLNDANVAYVADAFTDVIKARAAKE